MSILSKPYFHDTEAAFAKLESILWADGSVCPHCGTVDHAYKITASTEKRVRYGLWKCGSKECRKQFTVTVGTIFEGSKVPLYKWFQAVFLMVSSKKGISANQMARTLEVTVKTAWLMGHRIREAMREGGPLDQMGGAGEIVEVDETFIGREPGMEKRRAYHHKMKVLSLVQPGGKTRSMVVDNLSAKALVPILREQIDKETVIFTDEAGQYHHLKKDFADHDIVRHGKKEYVRGEVHTNMIEGYFSIFKRGMKGVYQHCSKKHLHRYLAEFDFRYNNRAALGLNDVQRAAVAMSAIAGRRLLYRDSFA